MKKVLVIALLLGVLPRPVAALDTRPLLYSLIVPGLGELQLGYPRRAIAHFGLEAMCWTANFHYRERGFDQRHDYEAYADAHWSETRWRSGWDLDYAGQTGAWADTCAVAREFDRTHEGYLDSHFAPYNEDPQHYYENLGKYDWYRWGWDDYDCASDGTVRRYVYLDMRNESNRSFQTAQNFIQILVLGRVVSLVDTFLILQRLEKGVSAREIRDGWRPFAARVPGTVPGVRIGLTRSW